MDQIFITQTNERLRQERLRLQAELKRIREQPPSGEGTYPSRFPHAEGRAPDEEAEEVEEYANLTALERTLASRLDAVQKALERIEERKYGTCERCGKPIAQERLEHSPEALTCSVCVKKP